MQIFLKKEDILQENIIIKNKETYHHLVNVLRIKIGEEIDVVQDNYKYITIVDNIKTDEILLKVKERKEKEDEEYKYILMQGIPKSKKMELIVEKTTELGVNEIIPIEMERSIVKKKDLNKSKIERLKLKAESASAQSKRVSIPIIKNAELFKDALNNIVYETKNYDNKIKKYIFVFYEDEKNEKLKDQLEIIKKEKMQKQIIYIIGPEGGISEKEIEDLKKFENKNIKVFISSLGKNILRTETAGVAALSIMKYELES